MSSLTAFLRGSLFTYSKNKNQLLKAVLPLLIIVHHLHTGGLEGISFAWWFGTPAISLFFAMSGYGLVISFLHRQNYLDGFLRSSLLKLFVPYVTVLIAISVYRITQGISTIDILCGGGVLNVLVPFSWFIFTLTLFYLFFYVAFRFVRASNVVRAFVVTALVAVYAIVAVKFDLPRWCWARSASFCVGLFVALFDGDIRKRFVWWHAGVAALLMLLMLPFMFQTGVMLKLSSIFFPALLFLILYITPDLPNSTSIKFLSGISLEMYLVQYLPIRITLNHLHLTSPLLAVVVTLTLDILLAFLINKGDKLIFSKLNLRR